MKKIILALLISFTALSADYVIKPDGTLTPTTTQDATTQPLADEGTTTPTTSGAALPTKAFNVLDYGLKGDGKTDDSLALQELAKDTSVTNWYFPSGKSFLIQAFNVPSHVKAIYGGGTIISKAYSGDKGAFVLGSYDIYGLIIDGLTFIAEDSTNWGSSSLYGLITASGGANTANVEIRNCTFNGINKKMRGIKYIADADKTCSNLRIHNNTFNNQTHMCIEVIGENRTIDGSSRQMKSIHINDNTFTNSCSHYSISAIRWRGGVGLTGVADGTESYIYNNSSDGSGLLLELGACSGVHVHNNKAINMTGDVFNAVGGVVVDVGRNFIYDNYFQGSVEPARFYVYQSGNDEIYNNFFGCKIYVNLNGSGADITSNFHDNTMSVDIGTDAGAYVVSIADAVNTTFNNNKLYSSINVARAFLIATGGTEVAITNNEMNIMHPRGHCIWNESDPITESENICNPDWTGTLPTDLVK